MHTKADPKKKQQNCAYRKACQIFSALSTWTNILVWKYVNEQIFYREVDLSKPEVCNKAAHVATQLSYQAP